MGVTQAENKNPRGVKVEAPLGLKPHRGSDDKDDDTSFDGTHSTSRP